MIATGTMTGLAVAPLENGPRISEKHVGMDRVGPMLGLDAMASLTDGLTEILAIRFRALVFGLGRTGMDSTYANQKQDPSGVRELSEGIDDSGSRWLRQFHGGFPRRRRKQPIRTPIRTMGPAHSNRLSPRENMALQSAGWEYAKNTTKEPNSSPLVHFQAYAGKGVVRRSAWIPRGFSTG